MQLSGIITITSYVQLHPSSGQGKHLSICIHNLTSVSRFLADSAFVSTLTPEMTRFSAVFSFHKSIAFLITHNFNWWRAQVHIYSFRIDERERTRLLLGWVNIEIKDWKHNSSPLLYSVSAGLLVYQNSTLWLSPCACQLKVDRKLNSLNVIYTLGTTAVTFASTQQW